jgi:hypothetical protein
VVDLEQGLQKHSQREVSHQACGRDDGDEDVQTLPTHTLHVPSVQDLSIFAGMITFKAESFKFLHFFVWTIIPVLETLVAR